MGKNFMIEIVQVATEKGEISVANQNPINTWSASDIVDEIKTYADQTFKGQSRFVKNQISQLRHIQKT